MIPGLRLLRCLKAGAFLAMALSLSGCGAWLGEKEAPPLPGTRIPILFSGTAADASPSAGPVTLPEPQPRSDWPQAGGNARHDSGHLDAAPDLRRVWSVTAAGGGYGLSSPPVVAEDRVYILGADYQLTAHALDSGKLLWSARLENPEGPGEAFGGGLAFADGLLFLTTGYGVIAAHDAETGAEVWRQTVGVPLRTAPAVDGGAVLAVAVDNRVIARAAADGRALWTRENFAAAAGLVGTGVPAIAGDVVIAPQSSGDLRALWLSSGEILWERSLASGNRFSGLADFTGIRASPVIAAGAVYAVSNAGRLAAFDLVSGFELWQRRAGGVNTPLVAGNTVFFLAADGRLMALSRQDGALRWQADLPVWADPAERTDPLVWTGPLLLNGRLVLGGSGSELLILSALDGQETGRIALDGPLLSPPAAAGGLLIVRTPGKVTAFR